MALPLSATMPLSHVAAPLFAPIVPSVRDLLPSTFLRPAVFVCALPAIGNAMLGFGRCAMADLALSRGLNRNAERAIKRGYRTLNLKTIALSLVPQLAESLAEISGSRVAYCVHHEDGFVDHVHLVAQFPQPQHLAKLLHPIAEADACFYLRPCRLFRASYRYLAHLDNPEKHRVDVSTIVHCGDWDGTDLAQWQAARVTMVNMQETTILARDYVRQVRQYGGECNSIDFAVFLDNHLVNSRSTLSGLRMMGITLPELFTYARNLDSNPMESSNDSQD